MNTVNRRICTTALLVALITACDDDPLRPIDVAGAYTLAEVAGQPLPAVLEETAESTTLVTAGQLELSADGDYTLVIEIEQLFTGPENLVVRTTVSDSGAFELIENDAIVLLSAQQGPTAVGNASGSRVSVSRELPGFGETEFRLSFRK